MHPQTKRIKQGLKDIGLNPNDVHIRTRRSGVSYQPQKVKLEKCKLSANEILDNASKLEELGFEILNKSNSNKDISLSLSFNERRGDPIYL